jgi:hypothetical protein
LGNLPQWREPPPREDDDEADEVEDDDDERDIAGSPPPTSSSAYSVASQAAVSTEMEPATSSRSCGTGTRASPPPGRAERGQGPHLPPDAATDAVALVGHSVEAAAATLRVAPLADSPGNAGRSSLQAAGSHAGVGRNESRGERVPRFAFSFGWEAKCTVRLGLLLEAVFATQNTVHDPKWVWVPLLELGPFGSRPNLAMPQCTPP